MCIKTHILQSGFLKSDELLPSADEKETLATGYTVLTVGLCG